MRRVNDSGLRQPGSGTGASGPESPGSGGIAPKGRIVTFYSYKGGTGRSMAVANVAWMLALNGLRVLVIDWDLEAPGIHRYFHPFLEDKELLTRMKGIVDEVVSRTTGKSIAPDKINNYNLFWGAPAAVCAVGSPYAGCV